MPAPGFLAIRIRAVRGAAMAICSSGVDEGDISRIAEFGFPILLGVFICEDGMALGPHIW